MRIHFITWRYCLIIMVHFLMVTHAILCVILCSMKNMCHSYSEWLWCVEGEKKRKKAEEEWQRGEPSDRISDSNDIICIRVWIQEDEADTSPNELFIYNAVCWDNALIYLTQWCQLQNWYWLFTPLPLEFLISPVYVRTLEDCTSFFCKVCL